MFYLIEVSPEALNVLVSGRVWTLVVLGGAVSGRSWHRRGLESGKMQGGSKLQGRSVGSSKEVFGFGIASLALSVNIRLG